MTLAIWDSPVAEATVSGFTAADGTPTLDLHRLRPEACAAALLQKRVDAALMPTTMALQGAAGLDFIPQVAVSSWKYPFARLVLKEGLQTTDVKVAYDRRAVQERFMADVVLREHYQLTPEFVPYDDEPSVTELLNGGEAAAVVVSTDLDALPDRGRLGGGAVVMDLGQEWFELTKYPMVWGLFAVHEDTFEEEATVALRDGLVAAEVNRAEWVKQAQHPALKEFFGEDLRLRYDDLVVAGLTELKHYLFYNDVLADIPDLSFAPLPEEEAQDGLWERG